MLIGPSMSDPFSCNLWGTKSSVRASFFFLLRGEQLGSRQDSHGTRGESDGLFTPTCPEVTILVLVKALRMGVPHCLHSLIWFERDTQPHKIRCYKVFLVKSLSVGSWGSVYGLTSGHGRGQL